LAEHDSAVRTSRAGQADGLAGRAVQLVQEGRGGALDRVLMYRALAELPELERRAIAMVSDTCST
jgi:hypothetical protein